MDKELNSLLLKYKKSIDELQEISNKQETVNTSEKVITNNNKVTTTDEEDKVNQLLNKLKLDVDTLLSKRTIEVENSKQDVQLYIDNVLWNLFSRTELNNNALLFNNDPHRKTDKECLMKMITTLLDFDKQQDDIVLHDWLKNVMTVYTHICTKSDKKIVLQLLTTTSNISTWAVPLIQFNHLKNINDYIEILEIVFTDNQQWVEDDYLAVLDQLAIDYTFNKLVYESTNKDIDAEAIFALTNTMTDLLIKAIQQLSTMKSLVKLLSRTIIHLAIMLIDSTLITTNYQEQIDSFIIRLVHDFYSLKQAGWFFLPNIPFKALSTDALWDITVYLLQIKNITTKPTSLNQVLNDHLPCITRFQYELADNQVQGYFILNCLTNIATCIPSGIDQIKSVDESNKNILSTCIVSIITYTLFTVAFIDKNLREVFYKDARDSLVPICQYHTFVISLLFRWTVQHITVMERMALYLFHSLDLNHWVILKDDLKLLHNLLSQEQPNMTTQHAQIQLAKYVIGHLNFGYIDGSVDPTVSKSQPWHHRKLPFLSYDIHEEIAFILLDTCQKFQPLPDTTTAIHQGENKGAIELVGSVTSAVSTYLPIADQILLLKSNYASTTTSVANEMIDWAWSIALQLKLYDCPVSTRATEIEKSITLPFLKLILNSYNDVSSSHSALLIYISFLLSVTSRHFLRFSAGDGWMKLLTILKRGKPEAIIQTFSEIIPSFVYMHGDDFFNDDSLADFFKHMVELRNDPILTKAASNRVLNKDNKNNKKKKNAVKAIPTTTTGVGIIIGSHVWQAYLIDSVSNLLDESGHGFSYVDLVLHSWLKTVFRKSDWMWHSSYVSVIDTLCNLAFTLNRHRLVYDMLIEERKRMEINIKATTSSSPRITRFIKTMIPVTESIYPSLLIGEWSVLNNLKTNTFNKAPGIETQSYWFVFEALVMETVIEKDPYRDQITLVISNNSNDSSGSDPLDNIQSVYKLMTVQKKPIEFLSIYRWLQHILVLPVEHVLLPLYLQMFFCLYYQRIDKTITFGSLCFTKKSEWITKLRDYIASVQTYYSQKMSSGHTTANAEVLQQTFYAMWLWLGNADLLSLSLEKTNINNLPTHYDLNRLKLCHGKLEQDQPWYHVDRYWMDLLDRDNLELDFLSYAWEGSLKFKAYDDDYDDDNDTMTKKSNSIIDDSISLSTTMKRQRLTTGKSTMIQLPAISISDPLFNK
ncbi:hypothetical protein HPULCUR_000214 [Helicostylum pulchrum]|uniref:Epg5-like TPR domain-containing protein n=1 Tax=Helicostylum pulchrum TaxID=562976 RepID=A0ABP9XJ78_9FUNG